MRQGLQIRAKRLQIGAALGLQIGAKKDYKLLGQVKRLQNGAGITNRGKRITNWGRDYKSGQGLQIGAAHHHPPFQGGIELNIIELILKYKFCDV